MTSHPVLVDAGEVRLEGDLAAPEDALGLVVFVHGSGSSRHSSRNLEVAATLRQEGFGTLLFDLLTPAEDAQDARTARLRFDIEMLARRLAHVVSWAREHYPRVCGRRGRPVGLFGASTGAAAALVVAAQRPDDVGAVVSRGGRPDLATENLKGVRAPTLLIVGGHDTDVLTLNEQAAGELAAEHGIALVPRAGHLFAEPGALQTVSQLASRWFTRHLAPNGTEWDGDRI